jgi:hypothetical protein
MIFQQVRREKNNLGAFLRGTTMSFFTMVVSLGGTCSACGAGACGIFPMVNQVNQY